MLDDKIKYDLGEKGRGNNCNILPQLLNIYIEVLMCRIHKTSKLIISQEICTLKEFQTKQRHIQEPGINKIWLECRFDLIKHSSCF